MNEEKWKGEEVLIIYKEENTEKRARGILKEAEGYFFEIETPKNTLLICKESVVKIKIGRGGADGGY